MDQSIQKFIAYLEELRPFKADLITMDLNTIEKNPIKTFIDSYIETYVRILTEPDPEKYFIDFEDLSTILSTSNLKINDYLNIVITLIKRNLAVAAKNGPNCVALGDVLAHPCCRGIQDDVRKVLSYDDETLKNKILTPEEEFAWKNASIAITILRERYQKYIGAAILIKEHYLDKINSYELLDIEIVLNSFRQIGISENILACLRVALEKGLEKQKKSEPKPETPRKKAKVIKRSNGEILSEYMDIDNNVATRYLTLEERIYCVFLLRQNGIDAQTIKRFLDSCEIQATIHHEEIETKEFIENNYQKIKFYEIKYGLQEYVSEIETALELLNICAPEEKDYYLRSILLTIRKTLTMVPKGYEYELTMARLLGGKKNDNC